MTIKLWVIGLVLLSAFLAAVGQVFFKSAASSGLSLNITTWLTNWKVLLGVALYAGGAVSFIIALKFGELSVLYPIIATSYIWVAIFSICAFSEKLAFYNWLGLLIIILGVTLASVR